MRRSVGMVLRFGVNAEHAACHPEAGEAAHCRATAQVKALMRVFASAERLAPGAGS
jgi:hypothetical protein